MRLKKLGAALVVVAALGTVLASSALAAAVTEDVQWYTGASPGTELSGSETMSAKAVGTATFTTEVSGVKYKLQSTEIECVECKIENSGGTAVGSGKLKFKKISVVEPAGCTAAVEITTKALSVQADWMKATGEEPNYIKFVPTTGEATTFATIEVTGCASATTLNPKGSLFVESAKATGTQEVEQEVHSSATINSAAGGTLHVGEEAAVLEANAKFAMSGANVGIAFGTKPKQPKATTTDVKWYTGAGSGTELSGSETMSAQAVGTTTFDTTVAATTYMLQATGVSCVECKIENSGGVAVGSGKLKFTGVTVVEPAGCTIVSEITTKALSFTADWMSGSTNYWRFVPTAGETTAFATFQVETCSSATTLIPKGTVFVETANATGTQAVEQEVHTSEAINTTAGGVAGTLHVGLSPAALTGSVKFRMSGAKVGTAFGTH